MARWQSLPLDAQIKLVELEINAAIRGAYVPQIYVTTKPDDRMAKLKVLRRRLLDRRP